MKDKNNDQIRQMVRETYAGIAVAGDQGCGCAPSSCCGPEETSTVSAAIGYSNDELESLPGGANLGLGCGNPQAIANLKKGETVVDLGSGAGIDAFLAARQVGETGKVIGVDMTPQMVSRARANADDGGYTNVEFRLGEIESLPVADESVDVIISNCVINLSPDKQRVFDDAFRVLRPGGRVAVSDVVTTAPLPENALNDPELYTGCVSGALEIAELEKILERAGFTDIVIQAKDESRELIREWTPGADLSEVIVSASIEAVKPVS